jgi:hypothetical protein
MSEKTERKLGMFRDIDLPVAKTIVQDRIRKAAEFRLERRARTHSREPTSRGPIVAPGREEEFRSLQSWLSFSHRLDRLIEATEPSSTTEEVPVPATIVANAERPAGAPAHQPSVVGRLARHVGQALRRIGEALEKWGGAVPASGTDAA